MLVHSGGEGHQTIDVISQHCGTKQYFAPHTHSTLQVMFSLDGTIAASTSHSEWRAPPQSMIWIAPQVPHGLAVSRPCTVFSMHIANSEGAGLDDCNVSSTSSLVMELVAYLARGDRASDRSRQACLQQIIREELKKMRFSACKMQLPLDRRAARVARAILAEPSDPRTLQDWASEVGACERTLSRAFERQTGLSFKKWQQRSRLLRAVELLRQQVPVVQVALAIGYDSASAFIAVFRKEYGVTPGSFAESSSRMA